MVRESVAVAGYVPDLDGAASQDRRLQALIDANPIHFVVNGKRDG